MYEIDSLLDVLPNSSLRAHTLVPCKPMGMMPPHGFCDLGFTQYDASKPAEADQIEPPSRFRWLHWPSLSSVKPVKDSGTNHRTDEIHPKSPRPGWPLNFPVNGWSGVVPITAGEATILHQVTESTFSDGISRTQP